MNQEQELNSATRCERETRKRKRERERTGGPATLLVPKAMPNLVQPLKGHWLKEGSHQSISSIEVPSFLMTLACGKVTHKASQYKVQ